MAILEGSKSEEPCDAMQSIRCHGIVFIFINILLHILLALIYGE